jgi:hypothetical protein
MTYYLDYAYSYFCDGNDLLRCYQSPEVHLANLDKMAIALLEKRQAYLQQIKDRCPTCGKEK